VWVRLAAVELMASIGGMIAFAFRDTLPTQVTATRLAVLRDWASARGGAVANGWGNAPQRSHCLLSMERPVGLRFSERVGGV
jgi:hypothetical protein